MFLSQHIYRAVISHPRLPTGNILEIGAFEGEGTRQLAQHFADRQIHVVDPFVEDGHTTAATQQARGQAIPAQLAAYRNNIQGLNNVTTYQTTSQDFFEQHPDLPDWQVRIIVIDGSHHYEDVIIDTQIAMACLAQNSGIIVFDDLLIADVARAQQEFCHRWRDRIRHITDIAGVALLVEIDDVN